MSTAAMSGLGEWTPVEPVTEDVKDICMKVKPDIEKMAGTNFVVYIPVSFSCLRMCGGTQYAVKVRVGDDVCVHAMISAVLISGGDLVLTVEGVQYPKTLSDPLVHF